MICKLHLVFYILSGMLAAALVQCPNSLSLHCKLVWGIHLGIPYDALFQSSQLHYLCARKKKMKMTQINNFIALVCKLSAVRPPHTKTTITTTTKQTLPMKWMIRQF